MSLLNHDLENMRDRLDRLEKTNRTLRRRGYLGKYKKPIISLYIAETGSHYERVRIGSSTTHSCSKRYTTR